MAPRPTKYKKDKLRFAFPFMPLETTWQIAEWNVREPRWPPRGQSLAGAPVSMTTAAGPAAHNAESV